VRILLAAAATPVLYKFVLVALIIVGEFIVQSKHYNNSNVAICASLSHARYAFKSQSNIHRFQLTVSCLMLVVPV